MGLESQSAEAETGTAHNARREQGHVPALIAIGVIASLLGIALGILIDWFPTAASEEAGPIDTLWDVLVIVSVPVFVLVTTVVLYSVWRFRMQPGEEQLDGPPTHGNTRLEIIWTAIPAILLVGLCTYAYIVLDDIEAKHLCLSVKIGGDDRVRRRNVRLVSVLSRILPTVRRSTGGGWVGQQRLIGKVWLQAAAQRFDLLG